MYEGLLSADVFCCWFFIYYYIYWNLAGCFCVLIFLEFGVIDKPG